NPLYRVILALSIVSIQIQYSSCPNQSTNSLPNERLFWPNSSPLTVCGEALSAARFSQKSKTDVPSPKAPTSSCRASREAESLANASPPQRPNGSKNRS